jgi:hypothetical protein
MEFAGVVWGKNPVPAGHDRVGVLRAHELQELSEATRTLMFVMVGTIIITSAFWQAAGFALARLENFIIPRVRSSDRPL